MKTSRSSLSCPLLLLIFLFVFFFLSSSVHCRYITIAASDSDLVSDGLQYRSSSTSSLTLLKQQSAVAAETGCEQTYGFLPCTSTVLGNLFLIIVYGFLMFLAARYLSNGSELLLEILGPGLIGGLFLPILGALPDAMLILVSGLSGTKEVAQSQVLVGMGLLAGSTVMLLTLLWGSCVIIGKTDLDGSVAVDVQDTKGFSLTGSGVSTDIWTSYAARIMIISVIPFIIVQLPQIFHSSSGRHLAVLISLIVALALLFSYCLYQVEHCESFEHMKVFPFYLCYGKISRFQRDCLNRRCNRLSDSLPRKIFPECTSLMERLLAAAYLIPPFLKPEIITQAPF